MKKFNFLLIAFVAIFASCSSEVVCMEDVKENEQGLSSAVLSEEKAIQRANAWMDRLTGETRSSRSVASVEMVNLSKGVSTRSSDIPRFCLVNYAEDSGFVLMDAKEEYLTPYAISDESNLQMQDTVENKALAIVLSSIESYIDDSPIIKPDPTPQQPGDFTLTVDCKPLLGKLVRQWGQREPFNSEAPLISSSSTERCPVGCAPLAASMIMSYCKYPEHYGNVTFDWDEIIKGNSYSQLAKLLKIIGSHDGMRTNYTANGSGTSVSDIKYGFTLLNYDFGEGFIYYPTNLPQFTEIGSSMLLNPKWTITRPAYMVGYGYYTYPQTGETKLVGHAWVVDGRLTVHYDPEMFFGNPPADLRYLHCVWGHYGDANGYFLIGNNGIGGTVDRTYPSDEPFPGHEDTGSTVNWTDGLQFNQTYKPNI